MHGGYSCGGQLFGFSGLDGQTSEDSGFVAIQTFPIGSLSFCVMAKSPTLVVDSAAVLSAADVTVATNDVMVARSQSTGAALTMAWHSGRLLLGQSSATVPVSLASAAVLGDAPAGLTCSWVSNLVLCLAKPASDQVSWGLGVAANAGASAASAEAMSMATTVRSAGAAEAAKARLAPLSLTPTVDAKYQKGGPSLPGCPPHVAMFSSSQRRCLGSFYATLASSAFLWTARLDTPHRTHQRGISLAKE